MNQKNIFTGIAIALILQGILFYLMGGKMVADSFPNLEERGAFAAYTLMKVLSTLSVALGLITYAARNTPHVLWAYSIGIGIMLLNTLNDLLVEKLNVPIPAVIIQAGIVLLCGYLWYQQNASKQA